MPGRTDTDTVTNDDRFAQWLARLPSVACLAAALLICATLAPGTHQEARAGTLPITAKAPTSRSFLEPLVSAEAMTAVGRQLSIDALLAPEGIVRNHWRSFDHVRPGGIDMPDGKSSSNEGRFVIVIDPGHGGSDPGSKGENGLLEKHLTLDIARRVRLFLSEIDDMQVILTRDRDRGLSRESRVRRVKTSGADLFVSLHFNHLPQREITLVESFYASAANIAESQYLQRQAKAAHAGVGQLHASLPHGQDLSYVYGSERFASLVQRRVYNEVKRDNPAALDAGVKTDTLFVLTRSETSGALVELTCLSNADEAERLTDESYRDGLAAGLADAIRDYRRSIEIRPPGATGA